MNVIYKSIREWLEFMENFIDTPTTNYTVCSYQFCEVVYMINQIITFFKKHTFLSTIIEIVLTIGLCLAASFLGGIISSVVVITVQGIVL